MIAPGTFVWVRYGEDLWHHRFVMSHVTAAEYFIATPQMDVWIEELSQDNADLTGLRIEADGYR